MTANKIARLICSKLGEQGYQSMILPIHHIAQLEAEIGKRVKRGEIDARLYDRYLSYFKFDVATNFPGVSSIILTAAPQPQRRVIFHLNGQPYSVIIPPTYYADTDDNIVAILQNILNSNGYQLYPASLPLKLLATHSGMARYGKNNIAYVERLGSFVRFKAFLSDMPAGRDAWQEPRMMEECARCTACLKACPAGAIVPERFLIHVGRCLTFHNELSGNFPEWVSPAWHNCLVGCMKCQLVCPVNKRFAKWVEEGETFNEAETELILKGTPLNHLPAETVDKLKRSYMMDYLEVLPRNLRVLLK